LYLAEPVPAGVAVARCARLGPVTWWAGGGGVRFPGGDPVGDSGTGRSELRWHGWIRLEYAVPLPVAAGVQSQRAVVTGLPAVVGIVCQARGDRGDGRAITL